MAEQKGAPSLPVRVAQGVVLGIVLSIPVVLWGLSRADSAVPETDPVATSAPSKKAAGKAGFRKAKPPLTRRHVPVKEAETVPASHMHLRIDDGSRSATAAPAGGANPGKADVE